MVLTNYFYLIIKISCLHTVIRYQVFLSNTNNFQTDLFDLYMEPKKEIPLKQKGPGNNGYEEVRHTP